MEIYWIKPIFYVLLLICIPLYFYAGKVAKVSEDAAFKAFQLSYMLVYLLAVGSDWLQGPFVYALYQDYGMTNYEIDALFIAGFTSSMTLGTLVGSISDKLGRRRMCIVYAILYSISCLTMHVPVFWILLLGRILAGVSTSLLFTVLESWLVCEHNKRGFSEQLLGVLFSHSTLANSLAAISAGHLSHVFADSFGFTAPFDLSIALLLLMIVLIKQTWAENYGDSDSALCSSLSKAMNVIKEDKNLFLLGLVQTFFEGAMYTFALKWAPALSTEDDHESLRLSTTNSHGLVFASFMVAVMVGALLFKLLSRIAAIESFMRFVLLFSASSLAIPIFVPQGSSCILLGFCQFEICVGIFWPALGTLRGVYIPETVRSSLMNIFRIPLHFIVIIILTKDFNIQVVFSCCAVFLLIAFSAQHLLYKNLLKEGTRKMKPSSSFEDELTPPEEEPSSQEEEIYNGAV